MRNIEPSPYQLFDYEKILRVRQISPEGEPNVWEVIDAQGELVGQYNDEEFDKLRSGD